MERVQTSELVRPSSRASIMHALKSKRCSGLQCEQPVSESGVELSLRVRGASNNNVFEEEAIQQLFDHLERLRRHQHGNYVSIRNSLRYPFSFVRYHDQPIWEEHSRGDQELTLA